MLMQHAFNSGVHFNLKLLKDQSDLLKQFANEFWREHFMICLSIWLHLSQKN